MSLLGIIDKLRLSDEGRGILVGAGLGGGAGALMGVLTGKPGMRKRRAAYGGLIGALTGGTLGYGVATMLGPRESGPPLSPQKLPTGGLIPAKLHAGPGEKIVDPSEMLAFRQPTTTRRELAAIGAGTSLEGADAILARAVAERERTRREGTPEEKKLLNFVEKTVPEKLMVNTWNLPITVESAPFSTTADAQTVTSFEYPDKPIRDIVPEDIRRLEPVSLELQPYLSGYYEKFPADVRSLLGHEGVHAANNPFEGMLLAAAYGQGEPYRTKIPKDMRDLDVGSGFGGDFTYWKTDPLETPSEAKRWADLARLKHGLGGTRHPTLEEFKDAMDKATGWSDVEWHRHLGPEEPRRIKENREELLRKMWIISRWLAGRRVSARASAA